MKTALIVDDSPSARLVLGRVLSEHALDVDTAASAEEALEYLKNHRPDVIFMDHLMPGMDGFQALEAIKANPETATIPVMMYTSQEGELYVGQARALGAFGVLPKQLRPVEVAKVLQALHLIPGATEVGEIDAAARAAQAKDGGIGGDRVRELLEELFYQQRSALREEIRHGYQRLIGRTLELNQPAPAASTDRVRTSLLYAGVGLLALMAVALAFLYYRTDTRLQRADDQIELLIATTSAATTADGGATDGGQSVDDIYRQDLLDVLEWGANQAAEYGFEETALDDSRAELLNVLAGRLRRIDYAGTLLFEVHLGRPCMNLDAEGNANVAPADQLLTDCQQLGWPEHEAQAMGSRQTLAFANAVATVARDGRLRVQTISYGAAQPAYEYPLPTEDLTAGEWNRVAAANHRVHVRLLAD